MHNDLYVVEEEFVGGARTLGGDLCFADSNVLDDFRLCERRKKKKDKKKRMDDVCDATSQRDKEPGRWDVSRHENS